ncbi:flavin monoamine oxidase family protein [Gracilimonas sp. Q87]|uniref:flavin monoamine oxidase family protein n=1 Tax=Gracilimonas sp. Q87 TaxID=3384766 RepID=UPI0039840F0B
MTKADILIIGGGLTGLTLAYLFKHTDLKVAVVEARNRLGGRILTVGGHGQATVEMGATWLGPAHTKLQFLLDELGLNTFQQRLGGKAIYEPTSMSPHQLVTLPVQQQPSFRIEGGTSALITTLKGHLKDVDLFLDEPVNKITSEKNKVIVESSDITFEAGVVVSTLPPKLLSESIKFDPELPKNVSELLATTHTWMGESIKFGLIFDDPFWLEEDSSGTVFSNVGPINEMYDHSTRNDNQHAIKGFLNGSYFSVSKEERLQMILKQLSKYYGNQVNDYTEYHELVWANEPFTYFPYDKHVLPHQNNGHAIFQRTYLNNKFIIAGAETAENSPGYMDGAVHSAFHVYDQIIKMKE